MYSTFKWTLAALLAVVVLPEPAGAASLLGGLLKTGDESGNSAQLLSVSNDDSQTSLHVLGQNGISVNLPTQGGVAGGGGEGGGVQLPVSVPTANVGVPGVVNVKSSTSDDGGSRVGLSVLGGGGTTIHTNPLGLLGSGGGVNVSLPNVGGVLGSSPGGNSGSGGGSGGGSSGGSSSGGGSSAGGSSSGGGSHGSSGGSGGFNPGGGNSSGGSYPVIHYRTANNGPAFAMPDGLSGRLKLLLQILAAREWAQLSNGRSVCLPTFGTAEVTTWLPKKDWPAFQRALTNYSADIYTLRQLLANCPSAAQRQALNISSLNRVIAIDIRQGTPVLFML